MTNLEKQAFPTGSSTESSPFVYSGQRRTSSNTGRGVLTSGLLVGTLAFVGTGRALVKVGADSSVQRVIETLSSETTDEHDFVADAISVAIENLARVTESDDLEESFGPALQQFVLKQPIDGVRAISRLVLDGSLRGDVGYEAVRALGRLEDPETLSSRLTLFSQALSVRDPQVRFAAILAIADTDALPLAASVEFALQTEPLNHLRRDLDRVLRQLRRANVA